MIDRLTRLRPRAQLRSLLGTPRGIARAVDNIRKEVVMVMASRQAGPSTRSLAAKMGPVRAQRESREVDSNLDAASLP